MTCAAHPAFPVDAEVRAIGALYPSAAMTYDGGVAPRAGAWIETLPACGPRPCWAVALPRGHAMAELMDLVSLRPDFADRYPPRSRVGRAGAAASHARSRPNPTSSVRDEPVSALDVSVQAQVPYLLDDLQTRLGLTYVFISHDLPRAA